MTDLIRVYEDRIQWPYSRAQLVADEPQLSLSNELPNYELESLIQVGIYVARVLPAEPPAADSRTERVEEVTPIQVAVEAGEEDVWMQKWAVRDATPEEIAAFDAANAPKPNYQAFYFAFLSSNIYQGTFLSWIMNPGYEVEGKLITQVAISLQDAMAGRVPLPDGQQSNSLQTSIWLLLGAIGATLSQADAIELQRLLAEHNLAPYYTLLPPQP